MRMILFGLITLSIGCGGSSASSPGVTTLSGTYSLATVDRSPDVPACFTSLIDPNNTVYLVRATLAFDVAGTGTLDAVYETRRTGDAVLVSTGDSVWTINYVRAGTNLIIIYKGVPGNGSVQPGDVTFWTKQPWCTGLTNPSATQRFDFSR